MTTINKPKSENKNISSKEKSNIIQPSNEIITVRYLNKYFGKLEVIHDISFTVHKGDVLGIIGPSGSGKSTLLRCICQLEIGRAHV